MGMIDRFLGMGAAAETVSNAAANVTEIFRENATRRMELDEEAYHHAITQLSAEFGANRRGWFDDLMNGLNRLPRPFLTLGTLGLFVYAMIEPAGFSQRMLGLQTVPEPLWWLLGAIVSFYFGAREAHYFRARSFPQKIEKSVLPAPGGPERGSSDMAADGPIGLGDNAALQDWVASRQASLT
ncbi:MAG TPA: holin family protein [Paracoccus sp. (in: a-proteobacteria)]|uniref:holin family protein n=1 Tax=uncultured Paracoccus sp. TaxID=189685 RepID=UPI0026104457|nr:holin family protein [uncultured Paracoccus sp.]HMQ40714.1 holin family protein [Paracoccus sp. (in: a-proteobacteria)]HMR37902.1 holin family protein [Paracoccus sp. (in: a-proteobacteria)]